MRARAFVFSTVVLAASGVVAPRPAFADERASPAPDAGARERSRVAFRKGVAQLRAQDWAAARVSFESAWTLYPHPSILLNLGIARLRTEDPVRAEQDLVRFLSAGEDAGASADELASAREALSEARARIGTLRVVATPASARVSIDGKAVETVRRTDEGASGGVVAEARAKPGRHALKVEADGFIAERRDVEVVAKGEAVVTLSLASVAAKKPIESGAETRAIVGWSLAGLSAAALVTSGVTALRAKSLADGYADRASPRFQDPGVRSEGITFRTTADVALSFAVLSGAAAVVLLFTEWGKGSADVARAGGVLRW
jgi:hypothetical protein